MQIVKSKIVKMLLFSITVNSPHFSACNLSVFLVLGIILNNQNSKDFRSDISRSID